MRVGVRVRVWVRIGVRITVRVRGRGRVMGRGRGRVRGRVKVTSTSSTLACFWASTNARMTLSVTRGDSRVVMDAAMGPVILRALLE